MTMARPDENINFFSERFKTVRKSVGISIKELSTISSISLMTLYRYENGSSIPRSLSSWKVLAEGHGMTLAEYMDALFGIKNLQLEESIKQLEGKFSNLEKNLKGCPLMDKDNSS